MRVVAHGAGGDGLWRLGLPSRNVRWVVHFLSTGIHGVVRVKVRQMRINRYKGSMFVVSIVIPGNGSRKVDGATLGTNVTAVEVAIRW